MINNNFKILPVLYSSSNQLLFKDLLNKYFNTYHNFQNIHNCNLKTSGSERNTCDESIEFKKNNESL